MCEQDNPSVVTGWVVQHRKPGDSEGWRVCDDPYFGDADTRKEARAKAKHHRRLYPLFRTRVRKAGTK